MSPSARDPVDTRVVVETPEGVDFRFTIAGPGKRMAAYLIDLLLRIAIVVILWFLVAVIVGLIVAGGMASFGGDLSSLGFGGASGVMLIVAFILDWFYSPLFEGMWNGQTPGKRMLSLRVVRRNGTPIDLPTAIGRCFLKTADALPFCYTVGLVSMLLTRRLQRLGDLFFDTMVIDEEREHISRAVGVTFGLDAIPRAECQLRYHVPERTLAVIERLFESDRLISHARREEIAAPLGASLRRRLGYSDPPPDSRNPNQYFQMHAYRHTLFLRRVLATFVDKVPPRSVNGPTDVDDSAFISISPPQFSSDNLKHTSLAHESTSTNRTAAIPEEAAVSAGSRSSTAHQDWPLEARRRAGRTAVRDEASLDHLVSEWMLDDPTADLDNRPGHQEGGTR